MDGLRWRDNHAIEYCTDQRCHHSGGRHVVRILRQAHPHGARTAAGRKTADVNLVSCHRNSLYFRDRSLTVAAQQNQHVTEPQPSASGLEQFAYSTLAAGEVTVCFDPELTKVEAIVEAIRKSGYQAAVPATKD